MSLCVAWKYEDRHGSIVFLAGDSCAVAGQHVMPYGGVKVLEIPVRIDSAAVNGHRDPVFHGNYGLAFVGQYFAAYVLKETISEVLSNLQYLRSPETLSFNTVCDLVLCFTRHFHKQIRNHLPANEVLEFFFGGFCPRSNKIRVAKFSIDQAGQTPVYNEILTGAGFMYETLGNLEGQNHFKKLMDLSLKMPCKAHFTAFKRLWDVIKDPEIKYVAGAAQCGQFEGTSFNLLGMFEIRKENGHLSSPGYIRGSDVDQIHHPISIDDLQISYNFGQPFTDELGHFEADSFWEPDGTRHVIDELITVYPHDPKWAGWFAQEMTYLRMGGISENIPIEHIGSTSVPGLAAIPCVDILVGHNFSDNPQEQPFNLKELGYEYFGDKVIPGHRCYRKRGDRESFNLIVAPVDGPFWQQSLRLRDYLRQQPAECEAYGCEKVRILNTGSWTLLRYQREKSNYLAGLMARANQ